MSVTSNISHTKIQRPDIQALGHTAREGEAEGGREGGGENIFKRKVNSVQQEVEIVWTSSKH